MSKEQQGATLGARFGRCPSYRESNNMTEERQGPTLGFCFREESFLQSQILLRNGRDELLVTVLGRCPS